MTRIATQHAAMISGLLMWREGFYPRTIINVGLSSCPEVLIWRWLFPKAKVVGIEPRGRRHYVDRYVKAVAGDGSASKATFCLQCRSSHCHHPAEHTATRHVTQPVVTIDAVASKEQPPFFIWMDIEGGEFEALNGSQEALRHSPWINIEVCDWLPGHAEKVDHWLTEHGYAVQWRHLNSADVLYRHRSQRRVVNNWKQVATA